jgi:WhiB family redox-sensing transcriptional regulator
VITVREVNGADQLRVMLSGLLPDDEAGRLSGGACEEVDPELWFPEKGGAVGPAKRICRGCDIRERCLEGAMARDERFGVWGGLSRRERENLAAHRRLVLRDVAS